MSDLTADRPWWPSWYAWDLRVLDAADGRVLLLSAIAGVAFDAGVRSGVVSLGGSLAVVISGLLLLVSGRMKTWASRVCIGTAMVLSVFLSLRTSVWLVPVDLLGCAALLLLAGVMAREGTVGDLPARLFASRAVAAAAHCAISAGFLLEPIRRTLTPSRLRTARAGAIVRGFVIAVPVVLVLGALLASADAVFASALRLHVPFSDNVFAHIVLVAIGALAIGGILRAASATPTEPLPAIDRRLGPVEWTIVLGSVVALFGAFAISQVITLAGGADHVLETRGLTYAEYARTGYGQLLAVTVITGLLLVGLDALALRESHSQRQRFVVLAELTIAMTAILLVVAVRRLGLYEDAYGWTMLRLIAKAGAVWLGIVLVLLGTRVAGVAGDRSWFVPASIAAGVTVVLVLNLMNPAAAVARHNLHHATHEVDPDYLNMLSDDAIPTIVAALPTLPPQRAEQLRNLVCTAPLTTNTGWLGWNQSVDQAKDARAKVC